MKITGMDGIPEVVVDAFRKAYPYSGEHLEFGTAPRTEVFQNRMLLKAFYDGYLTAKQEDSA